MLRGIKAWISIASTTLLGFAAGKMKTSVMSAPGLQADLLAEVQEGVFRSEDTPMSVVAFCTDRT